MSDLQYVGKSVLRRDGPQKVTGKAIYTVDVSLPGMLVGPHPSQSSSSRSDPEYRHISG